MAVSVITKARVGFEIALIATFAIGGTALLSWARISVRNEAIICGTFAVAGLFCWIMGWRGAAGRAGPHSESQGQQALPQLRGEDIPEENALAFLRKGTYWGVVLVISSGMLYLMCVLVRGKQAGPTPPPESPVVEAKPGVVTFPPLRLQGLVHNGNRSSAVINGTNLCLGEQIGDVRLVAVEREQVIVGLAGQTKVLTLPK